MSGPAPERLTAALADRYAIERELGAGGMAVVYLARDLRHGRLVALKVLRPELAQALGPDRFLREIETTAQLVHPHILPLLDSGGTGAQGHGGADAQTHGGTDAQTHGGTGEFLYYVMPFVEGESLRDRLTREKQLPLDDALQLTREVADALSYAHSHGVVHRDIKPENILLQAGHAVVADFGIAKAIAAAGSERLTETGLSIGTPAYMSPEQAAGSQDLDGRSDLYSLGCVLYEMLAGEPPFTGPSAQAVVAKRLSTPAPRISILRDRVPAYVEQALDTALARTPADRFPTATQFAEALGTTDAPGHRRTGAPAYRRTGAPWSPLAKGLVAAGVLVAVAVLGVLFATGVLRLGAGAGGGARMTSLAVLPLRNLSGDSTQEYVADGMTEAIITELGKISALTVISRTSVMGYKGKQMPLRAIARELGVQGIVEGSVLREGGQVRITARLIDGRTDRRLWDSTYNRQMSSILALYSEVARTIAGNIGATLTPEETRRLQVSRTVDTAAYNAYLLARHQAALWTAESYTRAVAHYRRAIALDSTFADPHAGLVDAYVWLTMVGSMAPTESGRLAEVAAERAVVLDPASASAHNAAAQMRFYLEWRWEEADREYRRALEFNPGLADVHNWYSQFLIALGRPDEAVQHARRAAALDPLQASQWGNLGWTYFYAGRFQEAIAAEERALELNPVFAVGRAVLGWTYSALGRHQEAIEAIDRARRDDSANQPILGSAASIHARAGRRDVALRLLDSLQGFRRRGWVDPYQVGWVYALLGDADRAIASFNQAIDQRSVQVVYLKTEWLPEGFKRDPRYHALLRRVGLE